MSEHYDNVSDELGRVVREAWVKWAGRQRNPKPSWLVPWDELDEVSKDADREIGHRVVMFLFRKSTSQPTWPARRPTEVFADLVGWCKRFAVLMRDVKLGEVEDFLDARESELEDLEEDLIRISECVAQMRDELDDLRTNK